MSSILLQPLSIHSSWEEFFNRTESLLEKIESQIGDNYTPGREKVLRFAETNLDNVKVIIIGKDP